MTSTTLGSLCYLVADQVSPSELPEAVYLGLEHVPSGRLLARDRGSAADVQSSKAVFRIGDVLYGKLRPYLDKAVLAECDGVCSTELLVLRGKADISGRYLACVVHSPDFIRYAIVGTDPAQHPRTSWRHIQGFSLPDFDSSEREAIAGLLWAAHSALLRSDDAIIAAERVKRIAMRELFTRGLRGEELKETPIGPLPKNWDVIPLGSLGRVGNGSTPKRSIPAYWNGGTYPWLTSAKVYDREIVAADQFVTDVALDECHLPQIKSGAVLIAITGQGKTLGHCAVLRFEATVNQHIAYVAVDPTLADPSFVRGYLETQYEYLRQVGSGGGSTKGALTCSFLRDLPIPQTDPTDQLREQREIVAILDGIDQKITIQRKKRAVLEDLFKSLLQELMSGEIRLSDLDLSALEHATTIAVSA